ncbi:unnamed protein product [Paramecium primaurelia]|uniref:Uncharacterized protein n=1 Tax=Paramecium primaurelia TaxID=5886 RepID=A0A8S1QKB8_PARPR|nr:unnamed protein product [Paramecium primaurelia]
MFKSSRKENEKELLCGNNHQLPILMVILDPKLELNKRLLCAECIKCLSTNVKTMGYELICKKIEEVQNQKNEKLEKTIQFNIKQIKDLVGNIHKLKSQINFQLDEIIGYSGAWIQNLYQVGLNNSKYSFHLQLEKLITEKLESEEKSTYMNEINQANYFWKSKMSEKLEFFRSFKYNQKCQDILSNFNQYTNKKEEPNQPKILSLQNQISTQELSLQQSRNDHDGQIQLSLKDDFMKQNNKCYAIAFNKNGSQMVSMNNFDIKVWSFHDGKLQLESTLQAHTSYIYCFVYSKLQQSFISCSNDKSIICWKKNNYNNWKKSQEYRLHMGWVGCMNLNKNETQLLSGGEDKQIIVWQVDLNQNKLSYLYSLEKHMNSIRAISLNESENSFVSCGDDQLIIIWEIGQDNKFQFKQTFKQFLNCSGCHLKFLDDQKFIWLPYSKELNLVCLFSKKNGIYEEDCENRIKLIINNNSLGCSLFPIIYLKDKSILFIRTKNIIFLLKEQNGKFFVVNEYDCITNWNFGNVTDDGKYLVVWDDHKKGYSSIELDYK